MILSPFLSPFPLEEGKVFLFIIEQDQISQEKHRACHVDVRDIEDRKIDQRKIDKVTNIVKRDPVVKISGRAGADKDQDDPERKKLPVVRDPPIEEDQDDQRSDIYSLGIVLYQCLNDNRLPFITGMITPEAIEAARLRRFAGEPVPDPAHGSRGLKSIALKAFAADPRDRFQTAGEMYLALMNVYKTDYSASYRAEFGEEPVQRSEAGRTGDTFIPGNAGGMAEYSGAPKNRATVKKERPGSLSILPIILVVLIVVLLGSLVTAVGFLLKRPSEHGNGAQSEFVSQTSEETDGAPEEEAGNAVIEESVNTAIEEAGAADEEPGDSEPEVNDETDTPEEKEPVSPEEQGSIGISGVTVTSDVANSYSMPVGVYVARILEGGGAANSDLQEGDIITAFDGRSVSSMEDLQAILQYYKAGTEVTLTVQRQNEESFYGELFIKVTLGTRASIE